jgi:hypothetical protein
MGLTANAPRTINELLSEWVDDVRDKKPVQELAFADDPIALSWASYHVWQKFPTRRWVNLNEVDAHQHDREIAAVTRRYYRDRFTMQVLRGKPLTAFQTVLYGIVSGEQPIMSDQMGALMKIPYFYVEDVALDAMISHTHGVDLPGGYAVTAHEQTITPLTYVFASRKNMESHQWWWTDPDSVGAGGSEAVVLGRYRPGRARRRRWWWWRLFDDCPSAWPQGAGGFGGS